MQRALGWAGYRLLGVAYRIASGQQTRGEPLSWSRRWAASGGLRLQMSTLTFWERNPPFAALATARLGGVPVAATPDPKGTKETVPTLNAEG